MNKHEERRQDLLEALRSSGPGIAAELAAWPYDEPEHARVRRDLKNLEKRGLVVRENRDRRGWRWRAL